MKIGFVGYLSNFDENKANAILKAIFEQLMNNYKSDEIEIVSGATNIGIPKLVYEHAKKFGIKCIGVMCKKGYEYELFPCDEIYAIGNDWGDESEFFTSFIDALIRIGGGKQSLNEVELATKKGKIVTEFEL